MTRRYSVFRTLAAACLVTALAPTAHAAWPEDQPIEVVVGFAPGGGTDLMARSLAPFIQKSLGGHARVVVINKPGASGEIANAHVARAKPDGYTLAIVNAPGFVFLPLSKKTQYKVDDFTLLARVVNDPTVLVAKREAKYKTLSDAVQTLKKDPKSLSFGYNGAGTNGHLALVQLQKIADVQANDVPFKGTAESKTALLGGHVDYAFVSAAETPELRNGTGNLKAVVQFGEQRSKALPHVPTATEVGYQMTMSSERGFAAPKGLPVDIAARLQKAIADSIADPEFIKAASNDAPVLSYLPGAEWQASLNKQQAALQALADQMPKQ
ncbi:Bug family tripartite tricarboxylate transporter substrate binding protein [Cupriavidus oxalaticus]|uniref:Bug family tripartite tricarboxylate transporter substrate binding protein n=1 Tax=Cupriavidus oxalaticus TaxID=96344 RepID=UPI004034B62D